MELLDLLPGGVPQGAHATFGAHQVVRLELELVPLRFWIVDEPLDEVLLGFDLWLSTLHR